MYILEGNIGAGKSTLLELIGCHCPDISVIEEPQVNWATSQFGQSLLGNFYTEPKRWAYTLETLAMICRVRDHTKTQQTTNVRCVMERSVYSGHYCFAKNDLESGFFTLIEWDIYSKWVDCFVHTICQPPHGFIYLQTKPEVCFDRVKKRSRTGEETIPLNYLRQIDYWHEKFLIHKQDIDLSLVDIPVLILDGNQDFVANKKLLAHYIEKIHAFMGTQNPTVCGVRSVF